MSETSKDVANGGNMLYHYTTQEGLLGILETKKIRATNLFYLNDFKELETAIECAKRILINKECIVDEHTNYKEIRKLFNDTIDTLKRNHCFFVTSFCEKGDLLSQWQCYGNNGSGYSIGFDKTKLAEIAQFSFNTEFELKLVPCIYHPDDHERKLTEVIDDELKQLSNKPNTDGEFAFKQRINGTIRRIINEVMTIAPTYKHKAFKAEKEWRLVSKPIDFNSNSVKLRKGKSTIIPYIEIALTPFTGHRCDGCDRIDYWNDGLIESLKQIYVGPVPDMKLGKLAIENFMGKEGYRSKVEVKKSKIPFRYW